MLEKFAACRLLSSRYLLNMDKEIVLPESFLGLALGGQFYLSLLLPLKDSCCVNVKKYITEQFSLREVRCVRAERSFVRAVD